MTEKQIEHLKQVLTESKLADNSRELDERILKSAHDLVDATSENTKPQNNAATLLGFQPISFLRSASLAIVFTVGVFFAMGQLLSVDDTLTAHQQTESDTPKPVSIERIETQSQRQIVRPRSLAMEPAPSGLSRDEILMSFELSDTEALLAELSFEFSQNSAFDQGSIEVAMIDINSLIETGELDNARQRYSDLKSECDSCNLPNSLEAFVLAAQVFATKKNPSKTG